MRLTCPRCTAQYEIPDSVIPATGREVECSACSHVWHQPASAPPPEAGSPPTPASYDAADRPALNRPLHESVLQVLREETARELSARASATGHRADPAPDAASAPLPGASLGAADTEATAQPKPAPGGLPDAARLAATLIRNLDAAALPEPAAATAVPLTAAPMSPPKAPAQSPSKPPAPDRPRRGYAAGFGLAAITALGLLTAYMLTPTDSAAPQPEWRAQIDQGRNWLHDRASALRALVVPD